MILKTEIESISLKNELKFFYNYNRTVEHGWFVRVTVERKWEEQTMICVNMNSKILIHISIVQYKYTIHIYIYSHRNKIHVSDSTIHIYIYSLRNKIHVSDSTLKFLQFPS